MGIVDIEGGSLIHRQGDHVTNIPFEKKVAGETLKKRPPKGVLKALLPLFEEASDTFSNNISPEFANWVKLKESTPYEPERTINLLRRRGFDVEEVSEALMDMGLVLAGVMGTEGVKAKELMRDWVEDKIGSLYSSTTEVTGLKK